MSRGYLEIRNEPEMKRNRMKSIKSVFLILMIGAVGSVLVACGTATRKAPIEDRTARQNQTAPASTTSSTSKSVDSRTQYLVKKGDTLYRIASAKGQNYTDLMTWNNLANPNDIKVGQILQVAPPETATSVVTSQSGVEVRPLGAPTTSAATAPSGNNKNKPRADKRPYSEAALAELQKSDATDVAPGKVIAPAPEKKAEKAPDPVVMNEIVWVWPVEGKVFKNFDDSKNKGVDFLGKAGQNVYAAAAGTVMYAGSGIRGYGKLVIIKHSNHFLSAYAHNQSILVKEKEAISKGQKIAEMGNSDSDVVKLHFEIRQQGKPVDPMKFLPGR